MSKTITGTIVCEYLQKYPQTPSLTLAKLIFKENSLAFTSVDAVRSIVRRYRGKAGLGKLAAMADLRFVEHEARPFNPFENIPEGMSSFDDPEWLPVEVDAARILMLADAHIPFHSRSALMVALDEGLKEKVDCILIDGDWMDFYALSFWDKNPLKRSMKKEILTCRKILGLIRDAFPDAKIVYKIGNHEERLKRYLQVKAPELYELFADRDLKMISYDSIFDADKLNVQIIDDKKLIKIGKLHVIHGHELYQTLTNPVNPARGLFLKGKEIAICAHHHRTSNHTEPSMSGRVTSCWSVGCLCDLRPEYAPINQWNHSFAIIDNHNKDFRVHNKKIIQGRVY